MSAVVGWGILAVYLLGYVACWRSITWAVSRTNYEPQLEDVVFGLIAGSIATLIWPLILIVTGIRRVCNSRGIDPQRVLMPRAEKRRVALDAREQRIRKLERELGITKEKEPSLFVQGPCPAPPEDPGHFSV